MAQPRASDNAEEDSMVKGQVRRGNSNKPKLTAKEKAKKKMDKKEKAAKV